MYTVETSYNDIGLYNIPPMESDFPQYQLTFNHNILLLEYKHTSL
jgi:hypothetical protein